MALALTACQTTKRSVPVDIRVPCRVAERSDLLPVLTNEERAYIAAHFSRLAKDTIKTPAAIKRALNCGG